MKDDMKVPQSLQECIQYFSDLDVCVEFVAALRWADGIPECPYCHSKQHSYIKTRRIFKCRDCRKQYSVKVGTIFEDSPIGLDKWLMAVWLVVNCKNGISSHELAKDIKITQKSAWFMLGRIRLALKNNSLFKLGGDDGGPIEVDETFVGGLAKNMHRSRAKRYAEGHFGKTIVVGLLDRELRQVRANVVPNVKRETLQAEILKNVKHGSKVMTDEHIGYDQVRSRYVHDVVKHVETYVNGQVHTNGIENFWSLLKRGLKGTYVAVEPFHLDRYVDEQVFRYNNRATKDNPLADSDRFLLAVSQVAGKRLTYKELTGKTAESLTPEIF